jgi:hypothetical protein
MRVRSSYLNWGIFLVCLGAVPLAVELGALDQDAAGQLLRLWPLILVGIGIGLLLRFSRFESLGGILTAGTFGILLGVVVAGGFPGPAAACNGDAVASEPGVQNGSFTGEAAIVDIKVTCADLDVARAAGGAWSVSVAGNASPSIESDSSSLRLRTQNSTRFNLFGNGPREGWHVTLPTEQALSVNLTVNAAEARLALGGGPVSNVEATYNAADGRLDLGTVTPAAETVMGITLNASSLELLLPNTVANGDMTLNAASLDLCAPPGAGLAITYRDTLSSDNFGEAGLAQVGNTWQSANFATAATHIDLRIQANVSTITLNPAGGCP